MFYIVDVLQKIRLVTSSHLPIGHSTIPYDIFLHLLRCNAIEEKTTVKSLFTCLPYSDMGVRYHFNRLIENGWIDLATDNHDLRVKICYPTDKLNIRVEKLVQELNLLQQFRSDKNV